MAKSINDAHRQKRTTRSTRRAPEQQTRGTTPVQDAVVEKTTLGVVDKPVVEKKTKQTRKVKASRKLQRQAKRVRREEERIQAIREENKRRQMLGQPLLKGDEIRIKPSIWERIGESKMYAQLREMQDTTEAIDRMQRKRVLSALFLVVIGLIAGRLFHVSFYLITPVLAFFMYKSKARQVDRYYKGWRFERQLNFSKFMRLVIPYLKASGGNMALYTVFNKILHRLPNKSDQMLLYRLMGEMGDNPTSIQPFLDFANRSSGTDMSHLFMSTIFDFQQSTFDTQVIDELGEMAAVEMMNSIDEIIELKIKRFVMFPTKVVMSSFILVAGLGVGMMADNIQGLGFSTNMINPTSVVSESSESDEVIDEPDIIIDEVDDIDDVSVGDIDDSADVEIDAGVDVYDTVKFKQPDDQ